jgi:predicted TIM-barrel fold metal-dependent hydrolase
VEFDLVDADEHYYETRDAFTRHLPQDLRRRSVQWADVEGRTRMLVGGRVFRMIPNADFDPIAAPGALQKHFRGMDDPGRTRFGELGPVREEYQHREPRLAVMDEQGVEATIMLPTLGVGMEEVLRHDLEALYATYTSFNRWLDEEWGFAFEGRVFSAPMLCLIDPDRAVAELDRVLEAGARVVHLRPGPVLDDGRHGRSLGDPAYEPFWSRLEDAGALVAYHPGDSGYGRHLADWGESDNPMGYGVNLLKDVFGTVGERPLFETMAALVCQGVLSRHPRLRVASIEAGSAWVRPLLEKLAATNEKRRGAFAEDPVEVFRRQVWVSPFYEEDVVGLVGLLGADHVLFGSDWPHPEGLADPASYVDDLSGLDPAEVRAVMRDNTRQLLGLAPSSRK